MNPFAHFQALYGHLELSEDDAALHVFLSGWNTAMSEMMEQVNKMPFGNDTRASFALYFQSQMVNLEAIEKPTQREPVGYLCENAVGHKYFRWKKPSSVYKPIALYTTPPSHT